MRVLFTSCPGDGHLHPLVPLARALRDAGHEVAFASAESYRASVERGGFRFFPAGLDPAGMMDPEVMREHMEAMLAHRQSAEAHDAHLASVFVDMQAARMVPDLVRIAQTWRPDVFVRDLMELGACVAAEHLGLPCASVQVGALAPQDFRSERLAARLEALRAETGLAPDPRQEMLYRSLHLCFSPPSYLGAAPLTATTHYLRPALFDQSGDERLPAWAERLGQDGRPVVYASLGTVVNKLRGPLRVVLEALRDEPVDVVMTVGRDLDPAGFGPQPAHVHVARYIPQTLLWPRCDVAVLHAGYNSATSALSHGLPLVLLPILADQPLNARCCEALGAARVLDVLALRPEAVRDAVREVLAVPSYRESARRYAREAHELPGIERGVWLLEQLVAGGTSAPGTPAR
ncbi:glycosyltransferase [Melittangium boletus]|uniref:glycosyltransferase n=1 Tax=Melittangium boletus TaxID=83453 RepID=UPI003DA2581E